MLLLSYPPFDIEPLAWVAFVPWLMVLHEEGSMRDAERLHRVRGVILSPIIFWIGFMAADYATLFLPSPLYTRVAPLYWAMVAVFLFLKARKPGNTAYKFAVALALLAAFLLLWVNGAVGIIGDEGNDANLMYGAVLVVGIIGAIVARFEPHGMVRAMFATALAQALVAVIALVAGWGSAGPIWPRDILGATGLFVILWLGSAWLFRKAAPKATPESAGAEG